MSGVIYETSDHKLELYEKITEMMSPVLSHRHSIDQIGDPSIEASLQRLSSFNGVNTQFLPEVSVVQLVSDNPDESQLVSIVRNNAHTNITSLFSERKRLLPEENTITVARGVIGSYPNVFLRVHSNNLEQFVDQTLSLTTEKHYEALLDNYGIRRTDPGFWSRSDKVHELSYAENPVEFGRLDYGRLENR